MPSACAESRSCDLACLRDVEGATTHCAHVGLKVRPHTCVHCVEGATTHCARVVLRVRPCMCVHCVEGAPVWSPLSAAMEGGEGSACMCLTRIPSNRDVSNSTDLDGS